MFSPFLFVVLFVMIFFGLGGSHQNSQDDLNLRCPSGVHPCSDLIIEGGKWEHWFPLSSCAQYLPVIPKAEMCLLDLGIFSTFLMMILHFYIKYQHKIIWFYQVYYWREK